MSKELDRRQFIKAVTAGTASTAVLGAMGGIPAAMAQEKKDEKAYPGKKHYAGAKDIRFITDDLVYIGVDDRRIHLFENVYPVPRGVSYNSYVILDEKTVLMDTVDRTAVGPFLNNLEAALGGRDLDYMVIQHLEPDHAAGIGYVMGRYPNVTLVCSKMAAQIIKQFFGFEPESYGAVIVKEGDTLNTGKHTLAFVEAPMVHWPEVIMTYDTYDKSLYTADGFGTFGALNGNLYADETNFKEEGLEDARRYLTNIVGKYGKFIMDVLAKAGTLDIARICPLHGPVWREDLGWIIDKYVKWATYEAEDKDDVVIMYGSIYGNMENAANLLAGKLSAAGKRNVKVYDVSKTHVSYLIAEAFRAGHLVFAGITYNGDVFTPVKNLISDLADHNVQNRTYSIMESGSWSIQAGARMEDRLSKMQNMQKVGATVSFLSSPNADTDQELDALCAAIMAAKGAEMPAEEKKADLPKWKCTVCGYIYEGETVPDDYVCPVCKVGKDKFVKVD